jgi:hypothetical protein
VPLTEPGRSDTKTERNGKWLRGLRWSQIDENMILRNNHGDIEFDLKLAPMVIEELALYSRTPIVRLTRAALPAFGPMIVCEITGYPYLTAEFRRKWRVVAKLAGVPSNVKNMDSLAAGLIFRESGQAQR